MRGIGTKEARKQVSDKNQQTSPTWMMPSRPPSLKASFAYEKSDRGDLQKRNKANDKRTKTFKGG